MLRHPQARSRVLSYAFQRPFKINNMWGPLWFCVTLLLVLVAGLVPLGESLSR